VVRIQYVPPAPDGQARTDLLSSQTVSAIYSLYLAMTLFPHVAKKAQEEIDAVVGTDRLPTFDDREHLPYIDALLKEVLRWNAVTPTG